MRILQIIAGLDIGGAHGGAERCGLELARRLAHQHSVEVCAFWQRDTLAEREWVAQLQMDGIPLFFATPVGCTRCQATYLQGIRAINEHFQTGLATFDIAHSHFQLGSLVALLLRFSKTARYALRTAHVTLEWGPGFFNSIYRMLLNGWLFPLLLDAETGVSQAVVDRLRRHAGARLAHRQPRLIYNALPQEIAIYRIDRRQSAQPAWWGNITIGSIGRLTTQKDYACLLDAFAMLQPKMPGAHLLLVGEGNQRPFLEEKARRAGIAGQVTFLGQHNDILALMGQMDVFVLPSLWEGLPTVVLECMGSGVPVIASDIPGTRELISHGVTGWLFPARQPARLAEIILYVLHHPVEVRQVTQVAASQLERFSLTHAVDEYQKLYTELTQRIP